MKVSHKNVNRYKIRFDDKITFQPSGQFSTEQHISQFGLGVGHNTVVSSFPPV